MKDKRPLVSGFSSPSRKIPYISEKKPALKRKHYELNVVEDNTKCREIFTGKNQKDNKRRDNHRKNIMEWANKPNPILEEASEELN